MMYFTQSCNYCQDYLDSYIPEIPPGFIQASAISFVWSFSVSILLSGNPMSGLTGGALAVTATTVHAISITLCRYILNRINVWNRALPPLKKCILHL